MKLTLAYTDLTITIEGIGFPIVPDVILIGGDILRNIRKVYPEWGSPKTNLEAGIFCIKCGTEINPITIIEKNFIDCPKCGTIIQDLGER